MTHTQDTTTRTAADLTATELLAAYRTGELSPVEATDAVLDRIAEADGAVNAYCLVDPDHAREQARASEQRWQRGQPRGKLDGVPTSIKDIFLTEHWPTLRGSRTTTPTATPDAPTTARLREHGAVFVGKTTTPELAWKGVTDSPLHGTTRNPWDTTRTAGGSSGGAAAAVALGMAPLAIGTDGGGSVRIPASFCGICTLKPTYGRIPHYPASPFGTLAHAGPMTTTVTETALMLDVLAEPDARDWSALEPPHASYLDGLDDGVRGLRIALSLDLGFDGVEVDPEITRAVTTAAEHFTALGATVERADPGFADPAEDFHVLWFSGAAKSVQHLTADQRTQLDPGLREITEQGLTYSAQDYLEATNTRMLLGQRMGAFHQNYDLLLTPTVPIPPFEAGHEVPPGWNRPRWTSWTPFTYPFNMTQQPAASIPCGRTGGGLPIGLQIVGPRHADALVLRAARAYEQAHPWSRVPR
ncbi:amidase [Saccharopolyspora cebuensis]|uniref:Amidase n=1 Tax=Saccharopolyspora cebuensis TaxID=418759 RepID=A0ABV4CQX3_9PSEU